MTGFEQGMAQGLTVTPALVQGAFLLTLPEAELEQQVRDELANNPALDEDPSGCPVCGAGGAPGVCRCSSGPSARRLRTVGDDVDLADRSAGELADLVSAAAVLLPPTDRPLLEYLVADLDDRGYLDRPPQRLAADLGVAEERIRRVVRAIRQVGPAGLCAVDLVECLLLQLDAAADAPAVLRPMIQDHLADLGRGRLGSVARQLGVPVGEVAAAWGHLRTHLRPHVRLDRGEAAPARLRPDLVFALVDGDPARVRVTVPFQPRLRLHPDFVSLAADHDRLRGLSAPEREVVTRSLSDAATFLDRLALRSRTLHRVGTEVAERQRAFLASGPAALVPMTRAEVAAALGLHESTVSRAVAGKWVQLPTGRIVALADLFGVARSAQECLRALVAAEADPLSDADLAGALGRQGHHLSRSAVRKYRQQLGIPARHLR